MEACYNHVYMTNMKIVKEGISLKELRGMALEQFGNVIKADIDVVKGIMAVGGELHVDMQVLLVEKEGSSGENVWGVNLYIDKEGEDFLEFDSMINLKPLHGNRTRYVEDESTRQKIREIVKHQII